MRRRSELERVLAIDPTYRGFGFVVMEGSDRLIDWGLVEVSGSKYEGSLARADQLIDRYRPAVLVLEDFAGQGSRRVPRVQKLILGLRRLGLARGLLVARYPRAAIRKAFSGEGARTKDEIAAVIVARFPELTVKVPPKRKTWMSEDQRMAIFDAAALACTYHENRKAKRRFEK